MRAFRQYLILALIATAVTGCQMMAVGPDLARAPSPFGDSHEIDVETGKPGKDLAFARIIHDGSGDTATAHSDNFLASRDFAARLTWYAFESGQAELDATSDFWLAGINIVQSPDRSAYVVLRLPDGWTPRSGITSTADIMYVTCEMMGYYYPFTRPKRLEDETRAADPGNSEFMSTTLAADTCELETLEQVYAAAPHIVRDADRAGPPTSESALPNYLWRPVTIHIL